MLRRSCSISSVWPTSPESARDPEPRPRPRGVSPSRDDGREEGVNVRPLELHVAGRACPCACSRDGVAQRGPAEGDKARKELSAAGTYDAGLDACDVAARALPGAEGTA